MKILIDASAAFFYHSTGIGAYAAELCRGLLSTDKAESIFVFTGREITPLKEAAAARSPCTDQGFWQHSLKNKLPEAADFDIYHNLHNGIAMKKSGKKNIVTIHDMIPCLLPQYCGSPYRELFFEETRHSAEAAEAVITVSENSKGDILTFTDVEEKRIHVIPEAPKHGCRILPDALTTAYLASHYHLNGDFFLYVGGFNQRKNVAGLLRAYAAVYRHFPKIIPLVIVGKEGSRLKNLKDLGEELNILPFLRFPGFVPDGDLPFFYNRCRGFFYPSFYEGFGLPPLEAAACHAPVVTSNNSSLPEIMGDGAIYTEAEDLKALGEIFLTLASDDGFCAEAADKALAQSKKYSYQLTAKKTLELYENICR